MKSSLVTLAIVAVALTSAALPSAAAIYEEGFVQISTGMSEVGYQNGDGSLWITAPSTLTGYTLRIATDSSGPLLAGNVYVQGGAIDMQQDVTVGNGGRALLEVTAGGAVSASRMTLGGGPSFPQQPGSEGALVLSGAGSRVSLEQVLTVGEYGYAEAFITDGAVLQSGTQTSNITATLASRGGSVGILALDGQDTAWNHGGPVIVGDLGNASLHATGGANITSSGAVVGDDVEGSVQSFGTVVLEGGGTRWITSSLIVGNRGVGELRVADGALLEVVNSQQSATALGSQAGSFGRLVVSGVGTRWIDARAATIGGSGVGELWIDGGAVVANGGATLGQSSNGGSGLAVVSGSQTRWQAAGLVVGQDGAGWLRIEDGATVAVGAQGQLGTPRIGTGGRLSLDGGAFTLAPNLTLENRGVVEGHGLMAVAQVAVVQTGQVNVGPGQRLQLSGSLNSPQSGRVEIIGGELEVGGTVTNGVAARVVVDGGTLRVRNNGIFDNSGLATFVGADNRVIGSTINAGSITAAGNSELTFHDDVTNQSAMKASAGAVLTVLGAYSGNGVTGPGTVFLEGPVSPGFSPGAMNFGGDVALGDVSELIIEAASATPGSGHDQLNVAGELTLGGRLALVALAELAAATNLTIATADELAGAFDSVPAAGSHLGFGVRMGGVAYDYSADSVTVSLLPTQPADFNLDGAVDGADFLAWQQQLGTTPNPVGSGADGNNDGQVDAADLALWRQELAAASATVAAATTAVPEPAAASLILAGLLALGAGRGRARRSLGL